MKKIYSIAAIGLVAATMLATGCKKENGMVTLNARIDNGNDAKVYVEDNITCWHNGDSVRVNNETSTTSAALGVEALIEASESNTYRAIFPKSIVGETDISGTGAVSVILPGVQVYQTDSEGDQFVDMPMGAYATGRLLVFRNLCSLLKVELTSDVDFFLDHITVTSSAAYLSGAGEATIDNDGGQKITMSSSGEVSREVSLDFAEVGCKSIRCSNTYVFYIVVPEIPQNQVSNITITVYDNYGREFSVTKTGRVLDANQVAKVPMNVTAMGGDAPLATGELFGVFSVGNDTRVRFSRGNLQYNIGSTTWQFAQHQYDYVGGYSYIAECNIGTMGDGNYNEGVAESGYTGLIDLFSWGANSATQTTYGSTFVEWGNNITDATYGSNIWQTLTQGQWEYLMNRVSRYNGSPLWGLGTIGDTKGLILLPDGWITPSGLHFVPRWEANDFDPEDSWGTNYYSTSQWAEMEQAGAVFLPRGGYLYENSGGIYYYEEDISYWGYVNQSTPYMMSFNSEYYYGASNFFSHVLTTTTAWKAAAVRLVRFLDTNAD